MWPVLFVHYKKLSYRRETARQLHMSRLANWSCTAQNTDVGLQLDYSLVVSTVKKRPKNVANPPMKFTNNNIIGLYVQ